MKHTKKKKRSRVSKQLGVGKPVLCDGDSIEHRVLNGLMEAFSSVSLAEAHAGYGEMNADPNKAAAKILGGLAESSEDQSTTCSSSSRNLGSSWGSSSSEVFVEVDSGEDRGREKVFRVIKPKKVAAAAGTVSTMLGKDYVRSTPNRGSVKRKGFSDGHVSTEDAEQFLYSMLGDECELSMAVVRDVLCEFHISLQLYLLRYNRHANGVPYK
ncbi:unnamed protein product [Ilex paraguariensis]|uniref:At5g58720/SDE5-like UBA-like domain-containing protein n=1 Tax=Ilex paraguariensis TaxID=185542 RepID=A0ABC8SIX5_9AQUA